jgi:branched-subunit amino acid ABC-type transport system permease component
VRARDSIQLLGPAAVVAAVGLVASFVSPENEIYFLNALVAVAIILTVQNPLVAPDFALKETIVILVGVVVGGIDRLWTATLGGFAIGFASGVINGALPTDKTVFLPSALFALVILVLLLRPAGVFARGRTAVVDRV